MSAAVRPAGSRWVGNTALLALAGLSLAACASAPMPAPVAGQAPRGGTGGQPSDRYSGYKTGQPYQVRGVWYYPKEQPDYDEIGIASWYGEAFHNHYTADGEVFDMNLPSAAHTTLPLPSLVEVTNLANGKTLLVRVNDRGPFVDGRIIDLSKEAAAELGFVTAGVTRVRVRYVGRAPDPGGMSARQEFASNAPKPKATTAAPPPSRLVSLAEVGAPAPAAAATADYDYTIAPKRPIPYAQMAHAAAAPVATVASVPVSVATRTAKAAMKAPGVMAAAASPPPAPAATSGAPLPDVDALFAARPAVSAAMPTATRAAYELQAGTFATEDSARRFASGLTGGGLPEVQVVHDGAQVAYQVVVHGLAGPGEAAAARSEALALGAPRALIVGGS